MWGPPAPKRLTPPHLRRYGWVRLYNDFPSHSKWRLIAFIAGVPVHQVIAVTTVMLCKASVGTPRGSLAEFSVLECAAALDVPEDHVTRIYAALEKQGWIDQEYLVTWDERQPDREDTTAAERQRRRREKLRGQRTKAEIIQDVEPHHAVTCVTERDVTTRQDKIKKEEVAFEKKQEAAIRVSDELVASLKRFSGVRQ